MYAQPFVSQDLVNARIAEHRQHAPRAIHPVGSGLERRTSVATSLQARRRAGWWLVTVGLRLAVGPARTVTSGGAR